MNVRRRLQLPVFSGALALVLALYALAVHPSGQAPSPSLQLLSRDARRTIPLTLVGTQEMVALDELAGLFQLAVRDDGGAITVAYKGRSVVLTPDQTIASVAGRLISLPAAPVRSGNRWLVPVDFIARALAPIYDQRIDLRRTTHLLVLGDLRVPRVSIRFETQPASVRATLDVSPSATVAVTQQGQRLVVRIDADALDVVMPPLQGTGLLQGIHAADAANLVLDLGPRFATFRSVTAPIEGGTRVTVDILAGADTTAAPTVALPPAPAAAPTDQPTPSPLGQVGGGFRTVAIDPGHGGDDTGAKGASGTLEKDVTLAIARRLKGQLEARLGVRVVLTRDDDHAVPVEGRSAAANNNKADLFVSLHANGSFRPDVSGASVSVAAFRQADLTMDVLAPERLPVFGGGLRTIEVIPWNLAQIPHRDQSERFARLVLESMTGTVPVSSRALEHAPLRVLESANMPAVLVEAGYLTNPAQETALAGPDLQAAIAQALLDAIVRFRDGASPSEAAVR